MLLNRMGTLYASSGMVEDALHVYAEAQQAFEAEGALDTPAATDLLANIGRMHAASGRLEEALKAYLQVRERLQASGRLASTEGAALLADIGDLQVRRSRLPDALSAYSEAHDALERVGLLGSKAGARALVNLGEMREKLGDSEAALESFNAAASIYRVLIGGLRGSERREVHKLLLKVGSENLRLGNVDVGFEQLDASLRHSSDRSLAWNDDGIALIIAMGDAFYIKGRYGDALGHYEKVKKAFDTRGGQAAVDIFEDSEQGIALESKIACTLSMMGTSPDNKSPQDKKYEEWHKDQDKAHQTLTGKISQKKEFFSEKVLKKKRERRQKKLAIADRLRRRDERQRMSAMRQQARDKEWLERQASMSASGD
jgi:tetratricopeptide (TPR) repeat protein